MTNPENNPNPDQQDGDKSIEITATNIRKSKFARKLAQVTYRTVTLPFLMSYKRGDENNVGFLENSIINQEVWHPDADSHHPHGLTSHRSEVAGEMVGYDFKRAAQAETMWTKRLSEDLPIAAGKLLVFLPDEIVDRSPSDHTDRRHLNFKNIDHILTVRSPSIKQAMEEGMIAQTSYEEAYHNAGLHTDYADELTARRICDDPVLQVTPKGNSLVFLMSAFGEASPPSTDRPEEGVHDFGRARIA